MSLNHSGWVLFKDNNIVSHGTIIPDCETKGEKLLFIYEELCSLLDYKVELVVMERGFQGTGRSIDLGMVRGLVFLITTYENITIVEVSPMTMKKHITGSGRAKKEDVISAVEKKYHLELPTLRPKGKKKDDNIADAIALVDTYLGGL